MENIIEWPETHCIDDEAATWLIMLDSDEKFSEEDKAALSEWLARSPEHAEALKKYNTSWAGNNLTELLMPARRTGRVAGTQSGRASILFWVKSWQSFSVTIAVLMVGLALMFNHWWEDTTLSSTNGHHATAVGQQKTITLADGSVVKLNTNSQLKVDYHNGLRNIILMQGEVYFSVAKDPARPFRVYARNSRVQAVGTAFTVYLRERDVEVYVTEGQVALAGIHGASNPVSPDPAPLLQQSTIDGYVESEIESLGTLAAGQGATLKPSERVTGSVSGNTLEMAPSPTDDDLARRLAWRDGLLIFFGETLEQVVAEVQRYTTVRIELSTSELRSIEVGGQIRVGDNESMFKALETNFGLEINRIDYNHVLVTVKETTLFNKSGDI